MLRIKYKCFSFIIFEGSHSFILQFNEHLRCWGFSLNQQLAHVCSEGVTPRPIALESCSKPVESFGSNQNQKIGNWFWFKPKDSQVFEPAI